MIEYHSSYKLKIPEKLHRECGQVHQRWSPARSSCHSWFNSTPSGKTIKQQTSNTQLDQTQTHHSPITATNQRPRFINNVIIIDTTGLGTRHERRRRRSPGVVELCYCTGNNHIFLGMAWVGVACEWDLFLHTKDLSTLQGWGWSVAPAKYFCVGSPPYAEWKSTFFSRVIQSVGATWRWLKPGRFFQFTGVRLCCCRTWGLAKCNKHSIRRYNCNCKSPQSAFLSTHLFGLAGSKLPPCDIMQGSFFSRQISQWFLKRFWWDNKHWSSRKP